MGFANQSRQHSDDKDLESDGGARPDTNEKNDALLVRIVFLFLFVTFRGTMYRSVSARTSGTLCDYMCAGRFIGCFPSAVDAGEADYINYLPESILLHVVIESEKTTEVSSRLWPGF